MFTENINICQIVQLGRAPEHLTVSDNIVALAFGVTTLSYLSYFVPDSFKLKEKDIVHNNYASMVGIF